jgi:bile acid-coenzyme A ligase
MLPLSGSDEAVPVTSLNTESQTLGERLRVLAEAEAGAVAITCGDESVTRGALETRTNRLARAYQEFGVVPDSLVTIGLPNSIEFLESVIAVWKCGATPQPMSSRLPARERAAIIALAEPSLLVGIDPPAGFSRSVVPADFRPDESIDSGPLPAVAAACWKAPTSGGSTGLPKLILSTQPAIVDSVEPFARLLGMVDEGTSLVTGPLYHNAPLLLSACTLVLGGHVVLMPRFDAAEAVVLADRHQADWIYLVPTMMGRICRLTATEKAAFPPASLRVVMHMAAPCPTWLKHEWISWIGAARLWELYGATEVQAVTVVTGDEWLDRPGTVGRPVIGEMRVLDSAGHEVPAGTVGELWMRRGSDVESPYRYIGASARSLDGGWESVGDMGSIDTDGYVYLADRKSDMLIVGGANVYPAEIEAALTEHPSVRSAVVIGLPHDDLGQVPHALVEALPEVTDGELRAFLAERLVTYKVPRSFERVTESPRDDAGKVRRAALVDARS